MMNLRTFSIAVAAAVLAVSWQSPVFSQNLPPAAPRVKSQKEADAIRAVQAATDPDTRLKNIDTALTTFADTEFKNLLLDMAVQTAQQKNDATLIDAWGERDLDANPHSYVAQLALANTLASTTKEFDLDKQEKLKKAEGYANSAITELKDAPKPMPGIPDAQWDNSRKQAQAEGYQILGIIATKRKDFDAAAAAYRKAMELAPSPATEVRLGDVYQKQGKYDEAIAELDKAINDPASDAQVKNVATSLKNTATKLKAAGFKPTAPATDSGSGPAPQQVEIKH